MDASPPAQASEDDDLCAVCFDGEVQHNNNIVFCDKCNVAVHQFCYGVATIPEGDWFCRRCEHHADPEVTCHLCKRPGGAMKQANEDAPGKWVHVTCAQWVPDVYFGDVDKVEPVCGLKKVSRKRFGKKCVICRERLGAIIQCNYPHCSTAFHPLCMYKKGSSVRACTVPSADQPGLYEWKAFCHQHAAAATTPAPKSQQSPQHPGARGPASRRKGDKAPLSDGPRSQGAASGAASGGAKRGRKGRDAGSQPSGKRRGRPPKHLKQAQAAAQKQSTPVARRRGRPPKKRVDAPDNGGRVSPLGDRDGNDGAGMSVATPSDAASGLDDHSEFDEDASSCGDVDMRPGASKKRRPHKRGRSSTPRPSKRGNAKASSTPGGGGGNAAAEAATEVDASALADATPTRRAYMLWELVAPYFADCTPTLARLLQRGSGADVAASAEDVLAFDLPTSATARADGRAHARRVRQAKQAAGLLSPSRGARSHNDSSQDGSDSSGDESMDADSADGRGSPVVGDAKATADVKPVDGATGAGSTPATGAQHSAAASGDASANGAGQAAAAAVLPPKVNGGSAAGTPCGTSTLAGSGGGGASGGSAPVHTGHGAAPSAVHPVAGANGVLASAAASPGVGDVAQLPAAPFSVQRDVGSDAFVRVRWQHTDRVVDSIMVVRPAGEAGGSTAATPNASDTLAVDGDVVAWRESALGAVEDDEANHDLTLELAAEQARLRALMQRNNERLGVLRRIVAKSPANVSSTGVTPCDPGLGVTVRRKEYLLKPSWQRHLTEAYTRHVVWRTLTASMHRGVRDQTADFNKRKPAVSGQGVFSRVWQRSVVCPSTAWLTPRCVLCCSRRVVCGPDAQVVVDQGRRTAATAQQRPGGRGGCSVLRVLRWRVHRHQPHRVL